jgi:hypothetical protein
MSQAFDEGFEFAVRSAEEAAEILSREGGCFKFGDSEEILEMSVDLINPDPDSDSADLNLDSSPAISLNYIWNYMNYFYEYPSSGGNPSDLHSGRVENMERVFAHLATTLDAYYGYFDDDNLTEWGPFTNMQKSDVAGLIVGGLPHTLWGIQYFAGTYAEGLPLDLIRELGATIEPLPHGLLVKCLDYTHTFDYFGLELLNVEWRKRTGQPDLPPGRRGNGL